MHAQINTCMKTYAITHAYADWCSDQQPDLYFVLNHANSAFSKPLSYEVLSSQVRRLFYQLECEEWGYEQRETRWGRRYSRIERVVCIEKATYYHANVMIKRYGNHTDEVLLDKIKRQWLKIQRCESETNNSFLFQLTDNYIRDNQAVSVYSNKDTALANRNNEDVLCLRASFISKHSNRQ